MAVGQSRQYSDFYITQYWGADSDSNPKADVVRVVVEVGSLGEEGSKLFKPETAKYNRIHYRECHPNLCSESTLDAHEQGWSEQMGRAIAWSWSVGEYGPHVEDGERLRPWPGPGSIKGPPVCTPASHWS